MIYVFDLFKYGFQKTSYKKQKEIRKEMNENEYKNLILSLIIRCITIRGRSAELKRANSEKKRKKVRNRV